MTRIRTRRKKKAERGFVLIDAIVGIALMALAVFSIFGAFKLSVEVIGNSKARVGALALAQERIEEIRSMAYDDIGTVGGIPSGDIPQTETVSLNNISYTRKTLVQYVDDPKDGSGDNDENGITADYKRAKVTVSWNTTGQGRSVFLVTNIVPKGIETVSGGGTLIVNVFDALGAPVSGANVHIENNSLSPAVSVDISTNTEGKVIFPGSPSGNDYEITVTKSGYSTAQTYGQGNGNANPNPPHAAVLEGETTSLSFAIDRTATKTIRTFSPVGESFWQDDFDGLAGVQDYASTTAQGGSLVLEEFSGGYASSGYALSAYVSPQYLVSWKSASWSGTAPASTTARYFVYYKNASSSPEIVPDEDLPGNSSGFTSSPVDLSSLSASQYDSLALRVSFSTEDASTTPSTDYWRITYDAGPTPLPDIPFVMRGEKTIGEDDAGEPIYKYSSSLQTGSDGTVTVSGLEWDTYAITIYTTLIGSDISEICPFQPRSIAPAETATTDIYLVPRADHSLLVSVTDTGKNPLAGASVRLYRTGYDKTQTTSACGQTFFTPLASETDYSLDVSLVGYAPVTINNVAVSGTSTISVVLDTQ